MTRVEIRPIEPSDKGALAAALEQSSDDDIYRRLRIGTIELAVDLHATLRAAA